MFVLGLYRLIHITVSTCIFVCSFMKWFVNAVKASRNPLEIGEFLLGNSQGIYEQLLPGVQDGPVGTISSGIAVR